MSINNSSSPEPFSLRHIRKPIAAGVAVVAGLVGMKGCSDAVSANTGELQPAMYLCLGDEARGRSEPNVPGKYDGGNLNHVLDLSGTPEEGHQICFPTEDGIARVATQRNNGQYVPDDWYKIRFGEAQGAIKDGTVINRATGLSASKEATRRLGEFASNWPTDVFGSRHTWVNGARAGITDTVTAER